LRDKLREGISVFAMSLDSFQRRVRALVDAAGGKKPLARKMGISDSAINSWLAGSAPFESKLREACETSGVSWSWLRDGHGRAAPELIKVTANGRGLYHLTDLHSHSRVAEEAPVGDGWPIVVRVLADRLTSTQIAEALNEILAHKAIDESVRNAASQILIAAQLPKLKR